MPVQAEDLLIRLKAVEETSAIKRMKEQFAALGVETSDLPPAVVLGVRIAEAKSSRAA
jgi:hypothetical protein